MSYFYSPEQNAFLAAELEDDYRAAGTWPEDVVSISDDLYHTLMDGQANGKNITHDDNGRPILIAPPPLLHDELIAEAENKKSRLLAEAESAILLLERAIKLGIATSDDGVRLEAWERYSVLVSRVDTAKPEWPIKPA